MSIVAELYPVSQCLTTIAGIDKEIRALEEQRIKWLLNTVVAADSSEIELVRMRPTFLAHGMRPGDTGHVLEQTEMKSGYKRFHILQPGESGFKEWTRYPVGSGPHFMRDSSEFGHINRGEFRYLGIVNELAVLMPESAFSAHVEAGAER